jgi:tRNA 2-thiouridine synthesizing protein A
MTMPERTTVDACRTFCPGPMMELIAALKQSQVGDEIELLSSDKGSLADVPAWVDKVGHRLVSVEHRIDHWSLVVRKMK